MKKIGILGSGAVAQALGNGFLKHGYSVMLSTRDTSKLGQWKEKGGAHASVGSLKEAAAFGDIIVLAVLGRAAADVIKEAGAEALKGKTVIDTTNPIAEAPPEEGVLHFTTSLDTSLMEQLQEQFPEIIS